MEVEVKSQLVKSRRQDTKFFHAKASSRKRKNKIEGVEDNGGNWLEGKGDVENKFCEYFQDLFTTSNPSTNQINAALQSVVPKFNTEMNMLLD